MDNSISSLRNYLFDALNRISNAKTTQEQQLEAQKSQAIIGVSEAILETAKVEASLLQQMKQSGSGFILVEKEKSIAPVKHIIDNKSGFKASVPEMNGTDPSVQYFHEPLVEENV